MARPSKGTSQKQIRIRISTADLARIDENASRAALTRSEYMRRRAVGLRVKSRYDEQVLNEMRRQGGLLKHLAATYPHNRFDFNEAYAAILKTLLAVSKVVAP